MNDYDRQGFTDWMIENELSVNTVKAYLKAMDYFYSEYDSFEKRAIIRHKAGLIQSGLSPATVNLRRAGWSAYSRFRDIRLDVKPVRTPKKTSVENVITEDDYERLLACLKEDGDTEGYFRVKFLACTGARISEFVQLKKKHLKSGEARIVTKGKVRTLYIPRTLIEESAAYFEGLDDEDYLFQPQSNKDRGRPGNIPLHREAITSQLYRWADKYDIPKEVMHPHSFRHRFAINFLKQNGDVTLLADLLGHSGVNTTMIYTRRSKEEQRQAVDTAIDW